MMEHERQLENFRCYEAAVDAVYSFLGCEGGGFVSHEHYDVVRMSMDSLQETWDETIAGFPSPIKDGEHSYFLS